MTLPYPYGIENGDLEPSHENSPERLDIEHRVRRLVVPDGNCVELAGHRLGVEGPKSAVAETEHVRRALTERLLQRRPNADDATWNKLESSLRASLSSKRTLDQAVLDHALSTVDGL